MKLPSVSIGIPVWNRKNLVTRAIRSALAQDYPGMIEVVVADDGSTDGTLDVAESFGGRVKVIAGEHHGIAWAKNQALTEGSGEVRGILDSDDYYEPNFVRRCVEVLNETGAGCVYTDNWSVAHNGRRLGAERAIDPWTADEMARTCNIRGDCWLAWWGALRQTGLHDERLELDVDYDLFYQLGTVTAMRRVAEPLHNVVSHAGRASGDRARAAYWNAVVLGKYGLPIKHALARAQRFGVGNGWDARITEGYADGVLMRSPVYPGCPA